MITDGKGRTYSAFAVVIALLCHLVFVPQIAGEGLYLFGKAGICFLPAAFRTAFAVLAVEILLIFIFWWVLKRSRITVPAVLLASIAIMVGTGTRIGSAVKKSGMQRYCEGFADRVRDKGNLSEISSYLDRVRHELDANGTLYKIDGSDYFRAIKSGNVAMVTASGPGGAEDKPGVVVLWSCAGGGVGIYAGKMPLVQRGWIDRSVQLTNELWVITRQD